MSSSFDYSNQLSPQGQIFHSKVTSTTKQSQKGQIFHSKVTSTTKQSHKTGLKGPIKNTYKFQRSLTICNTFYPSINTLSYIFLAVWAFSIFSKSPSHPQIFQPRMMAQPPILLKTFRTLHVFELLFT